MGESTPIFGTKSEAIKSTEITSDTKEKFSSVITEENVQNILDEIANMNFVELNQIGVEVNKQRDNLENTKEAFKALEQIKVSGGEIGTQVMLSNQLDDINFQNNLKAFEESYKPNLEKLDRLTEAINNRIAEFDDVKKDAAFFTTQLIDTLSKKIELAKKEENPNQELIDVLSARIEILKNRYDYSFILKKTDIAHTIKDIKRNFVNRKNDTVEKMKKELVNHFLGDQIYGIGKYIQASFDGDGDAALVFLCHIAQMMKHSKNNSVYKIRVFMMNLLDAFNDDISDTNIRENLDKFMHQIHQKYTL